ncbi:adenosylcobinamide-GDP ribazoletransferase [Paenibacillus silvae]|uniref:adenosylcobinamide-GDP ribazoletransferase n=1 Tax=Paenibacillus silvae TaxID=1325358 RepID=UPI00200432F3|nr:adenosylcobinamide-GDP ribazoletransferase [Paenibacillus silvae]MCK6074756.1 adenosylcobinamide-GDP ribazoletransferase [Paenibacillus silvae]MCK6147769.1 adenosylcobinamide-GDP ribazoletransferase [Paenibacillus silvae]MCK6266067.1 adenosylcobinamide-GDP ribazoletransferase [Paenibacillus silvae]
MKQGESGSAVPQRKHAAAAAFQFLSRFPVKMQLDFVPPLLRESVVYYPLVGAAIGLCVWLVGALSGQLLPALPAAVLTLTLWVWLTGGLHLDGWMDTADGLLSYRSRERMLEIMKDSRVGAMGVIACVLLLMMKAALIADFIARGSWVYGALLILPMIWSRWFMVYAMSAWPNARGDDGLAVLFKGLGERREVQRSRRAALMLTLIAGVVTLAAVGLFKPDTAVADAMLSGFGTLPWWLYPVSAVIVLPVACYYIGRFVASRISARLGGLTGDTYGAMNELLEAALLTVLSVLQGLFWL